MDLNQALNLPSCAPHLNRYKDYQEVETRHHDFNQNVNNRTFDINPTNIKYQNKNYDPYKQVKPMGPLPNQPQSSTPLMMGQSLLMNPSYFPTPVNRSVPESPMTQPYLQMKQAQELQTMMENGDSNVDAIEKLKLNQANQIQKNLQMQTQFNQGPSALDRNDQLWATTSSIKVINQTHGYNAQGQAVSDRSTLFQDRNNKYKMLKEMSPEMLNKLYGRPSDQSTLPNQSTPTQIGGDIYDQTSCLKTQPSVNYSHNQLKGQLQARQKSIMTQRHKQGIQSFNTVSEYAGTNINDAYANLM